MRGIVACVIALVASAAVSLAHAQQPSAAAGTPKGELGARLETVTSDIARQRKLALPFGTLVAEVAAGGAAAKAGLTVGDVIQTVNDTPVRKVEDAEALLSALAPGASVRLRVMRGLQMKEAIVVLAAPTPMLPRVDTTGTDAVLMLDTGGHMAIIKGLAFTQDGNRVVSAGEDRVIRVWDWRTGRTVRTIRGAVGPDWTGQIFAMALSPAPRDRPTAGNRWLAVAGWMKAPGRPGHHIRLYDFVSGRLMRKLQWHGNVIAGLAFSPDGKLLISGSSDRTAIIWDVATGRLLHRLKGHKRQINAVGFSTDGERAITGGYDHVLRLWDADTGRELAKLTGHGAPIRNLAVNPKDGTIASGSVNGEILLWDGKTGEFLKLLVGKTGKSIGSVSSLEFTPDGRRLVSTCGQNCSGDFGARVWDVAAGRQVGSYLEHDNIVLTAALSPDGRTVATGGGDNNEVHVWDLATSKRLTQKDGTALRLAGTGRSTWAGGFSADGRSIAWGSTYRRFDQNNRGLLEFQLRLPTTTARLGQPEKIAAADSANPDAWFRGSATQGGLKLSHRSGGESGYREAVLDIQRDGSTIASITRDSTDGIQHRSYTLSLDGRTIVSGGAGGVVIGYDLGGKTLGRYFGHDSEVWSVTPSPDGRFLLSTSDDQTVRLWNFKSRELIVSLFHGSNGQWVMWTPQGYFTGSPGAEDLVGWNLNRGPDKEALWVTAEQLRSTFYRPDVVEKAIVLASARTALAQLGLRLTAVDVLKKPLPVLRTIWPLGGMALAGGRGVFTIAVKKGAPPPTEWNVRVGAFSDDPAAEITVTPRAVALPAGHPPVEPDEDVYAFEIPLRKGQNIVKIRATNVNGPSLTHEHALFHPGEGDLDERGTLHVLSVGVDRYPGAKPWLLDLGYAGRDAKAFAKVAARTMKGRHRAVRVETLCSDDCTAIPTHANILAALGRIAAAGERDTVVVFMAGHGESDQQRYYFLPTDLKRSGPNGRISLNTLAWSKVEDALGRARGAKFLFVDACRSAKAYHDRLLNDARQKNVIAFSSAGADQKAWEDPKVGHGLFTYWLMNGLDGQAAERGNGAVKVYKLGAFLAERVPEHAARLRLAPQEPVYAALPGSNAIIVQPTARR